MARFCAGLALAMCLLSAAPAWAGNFQVIPVKLEMGPDTKTGVLRVINQSDQALTIQVTSKVWTQPDGSTEDRYEDTRDIVLFPPLFTLKPGQEQVLRIGYRGPAGREQERAYRVFLEELPVEAPGATVLRLALRIGVPVFVQPPEATAQFKAQPLPVTQSIAGVAVTNAGNRHIIVGDITAVGRDRMGQEILNRKRAGWYVLARSMRPFGVLLDEQVCRQVAELTLSVVIGRELHDVSIPPPPDATHCIPPKDAKPVPPPVLQRPTG